MIIQLIPRIGGPPVVLDVSQFVVLDSMGTPISVGALYGPEGAVATSCVGCEDFPRMLRMLGIQTTIVVNKLVMPKPESGVKLLAGPK